MQAKWTIEQKKQNGVLYCIFTNAEDNSELDIGGTKWAISLSDSNSSAPYVYDIHTEGKIVDGGEVTVSYKYANCDGSIEDGSTYKVYMNSSENVVASGTTSESEGFKFEVPSDYLEMITPMGYCRAAEYTIERFGLNEKPEDLIQEWHGMAAEAYAKKVELKSHAKEYLLKLKKTGTRIAAATSSAYELIAPCLERNGVLECFDAFVTTMEVPHGKDFPDVYLEAAKRLKLSPEECLVYEDIYKESVRRKCRV